MDKKMDVDQLNDSRRNLFAVATWNNTHGPFWIKLDPKSQTSSLLNDFIEGFRNLPAIGHTLPWRHGWICSTLVVVAFLGEKTRLVKREDGEMAWTCTEWPPQKGISLDIKFAKFSIQVLQQCWNPHCLRTLKVDCCNLQILHFWINSCISYHLGHLVKGAGGS